LTATFRKVIENEDTIVMTEAITSYETVSKHLPRNKPVSLFASGASSLGWHGGAFAACFTVADLYHIFQI